MPEKTILQRLKDLTAKTAEKINALNTKIGEISPFKGLSPDIGNSLSLDEEEKLFFKERTAEEIAQAYEGLNDTNKYTDQDKQTVEDFANFSVEFDLQETTNQGATTDKVIEAAGYKRTGSTSDDLLEAGGGAIPKSTFATSEQGEKADTALQEETDPTVPSWVKAITEQNLSDFQSAYNWGNHSEAGYELQANKGQANGYAPLDTGAKISETYLPDSILGQVSYQGTWDAANNTPAIPTAASANKGWYFIASSSIESGHGYPNVPNTDFKTGDWIISNGSSWAKVDNSDSVSTVFGRLGNIVANEADYEAFYPKLSATYANPSWINSLAFSKITGKPTTLSGYGITDAINYLLAGYGGAGESFNNLPKGSFAAALSGSLSNRPTVGTSSAVLSIGNSSIGFQITADRVNNEFVGRVYNSGNYSPIVTFLHTGNFNPIQNNLPVLRGFSSAYDFEFANLVKKHSYKFVTNLGSAPVYDHFRDLAVSANNTYTYTDGKVTLTSIGADQNMAIVLDREVPVIGDTVMVRVLIGIPSGGVVNPPSLQFTAETNSGSFTLTPNGNVIAGTTEGEYYLTAFYNLSKSNLPGATTVNNILFGIRMRQLGVYFHDNVQIINLSKSPTLKADNKYPIQLTGDSLAVQNPLLDYAATSNREMFTLGYNGAKSNVVRKNFLDNITDLTKLRTHIFYTGRNNYSNPDQVIQDIQEMLKVIDHERFLIMTPPLGGYLNDFKSTNTSYNRMVYLENRIAKQYPSNHLITRTAMIDAFTYGDVRLTASFTQPAVNSTVQITVNNADYLMVENSSDVTNYASYADKIRIGFQYNDYEKSDLYEVVSQDSSTQLTVRLLENDSDIAPGGTVENPSVDGDFYYLPVMKEMDVFMIKEGVLPASLRNDAIHPSTEGKSLLNSIVEKVLEVKNI